LNNYDEIDKERIRKNEALIKKWVQDLYWEIALPKPRFRTIFLALP